MEDRRKLDQMEHVVTVSYAEDEGRGSDHMALDDEQVRLYTLHVILS